MNQKLIRESDVLEVLTSEQANNADDALTVSLLKRCENKVRTLPKCASHASERAIEIIRGEMSVGLSDETQRVLTRCINLMSREPSAAPEDVVKRTDVLRLIERCIMSCDEDAVDSVERLRAHVADLPNASIG